MHTQSALSRRDMPEGLRHSVAVLHEHLAARSEVLRLFAQEVTLRARLAGDFPPARIDLADIPAALNQRMRWKHGQWPAHA